MSGPEMRKEQDRLARLVHEAVAGLPPAPDHLWTALETRLRRTADSAVIAEGSFDIAQQTLRLGRATLEALVAGLRDEGPDAAVLTLNLASLILQATGG